MPDLDFQLIMVIKNCQKVYNCCQNAPRAEQIGLINESVPLSWSAAEKGENRAAQVCCLSTRSSFVAGLPLGGEEGVGMILRCCSGLCKWQSVGEVDLAVTEGKVHFIFAHGLLCIVCMLIFRTASWGRRKEFRRKRQEWHPAPSPSCMLCSSHVPPDINSIACLY